MRATDTLYSTTAQFSILRAPTSSNGTSFGPGSANNLLKSNGSSIYWTTLAASDIPTISITDKTSGTLTVARGGTGQTSIANIQAGKDGDGNTISSTYLKLEGGDLTGDLTLTATSGNSPALIFNRGTGSLTDWRIFVTSGKLSFQSAINNSTYTERAYFEDNSGVFVATTFKGNLTGNVNGTANNVTGVVAIQNGGTGENNAIDAINGLLTNLPILTTSGDFSHIIAKSGNSYHQIPKNDIYEYIKSDLVPLALTAAATGFTITGGTTSKTLTVSENTTLKGGSSTYLAYYSANNTISGHSYAHFSDTYSSSTKNGKNELVLGNATASTSNGSAYGQLALYSSGTKGTYLAAAANSTAWYTATLPAASGTIAYTTSDITGTAANVTGTVTVGHGGTGFTEYTKGDLLYASNTNALSKLSIGTKGYYLNSTADGPVWRRPQLYFGTCDSAATATTKEVTCDEYDTLTIGDLIVVKFSITNTGAVGSLKLKVNKTDAIAIKKQYHSNSTAQNLSHASELNNSTIALFCYNGTYWIYLNGDYNSTYTINNSLVTSSSGSNITAETSDNGGVGLRGYALMMMTTNQTWSAISHVSGSTAADQGANSAKVAATANFLLNSPILYIDTKAYVAPGNSSNLTSYTAIAFNLRYSIGITGNTAPTLTSQKPVYLVGIVNSDNSTFKLDSTQWWTQTLPTSNDGKIYILLGLAYSASNIYLNTFHPIFYHNGTCIMPYTPGTIPVEQGGTSATTAAGARTNLGLGNVENTALSTWAGTSNITTVGTISTGTWQGTAIASSYIGSHSTDKLTSGTLPVARGGTGITTSTYKNAVLVGNSSTVTNAFHTIRTANGAFYATAQDGAPSFGTLPVAQGGTGQTSVANIKAGKDGDGNTISSTYLKLSGDTLTGRLTAPEINATRKMVVSAGKVYSNITGSNVLLPAKTTMLFADGLAIANPGLAGANDLGWIRVTGTAETDTILEIATGDDGGTGEQIVVRQYNTSNAVAHQAILLSMTGATSFPVSVTAPTFTATASVGLTIMPASYRAYLNLAPSTDTHSDIKFSRAGTDTWALSARSSSDGFFGLYNHLTSSWPIKVSETSNQVSLLGSLIVGTGNQSLDLKAADNGTSSSIWLPDIHWIDKNGLDPGLISAGGYSGGNSFLYLGVRNYNSNGERTTNSGISILGGKDGSVSYLFNGSGNASFTGTISTKYITVNAWDTNTEGGEIKLAGAPGYQSGKYYACLDVNSQDFRIHSNSQVPFRINLENLTTTIHKLTLTNVLAIQYGGTGASTASAARHNLGIYETIKTNLAVSANGVTSFAVTDSSVKTSSIILITTDTEKTYASVVVETGKYTIKVTNNNTTSKTIKAYVLIIY